MYEWDTECIYTKFTIVYFIVVFFLHLGETGRQAFEEAQLTSHGFQGLHVKKWMLASFHQLQSIWPPLWIKDKLFVLENSKLYNQLVKYPIRGWLTNKVSNQRMDYKQVIQSENGLQTSYPIREWFTNKISNQRMDYKQVTQSVNGLQTQYPVSDCFTDCVLSCIGVAYKPIKSNITKKNVSWIHIILL